MKKYIKIALLLSISLTLIAGSWMLYINDYNIIKTLNSEYFKLTTIQIVIMSFLVSLFVNE